MRKFAVRAAFFGAACLVAGAANAVCLTLPNTLLNGVTADAALVMGNFNAIATCINTPGTLFGNQTANKIYSGPASGGAASPTFRSLVEADLPTFVTASVTPSNPSGTTDLTGKMMGLASVVTPTASGKLLVIHTGLFTNSTINDGASVTLRHGTGTAPANGAALTGTIDGNNPQMIATSGAATQPFTIAWTITGLTVGTPYWFDFGLSAITGGTAAITNVGVTINELP